MRWLDGITNAMAMNLGTLGEMVRNREDNRHYGVGGIVSPAAAHQDCSKRDH